MGKQSSLSRGNSWISTKILKTYIFIKKQGVTLGVLLEIVENSKFLVTADWGLLRGTQTRHSVKMEGGYSLPIRWRGTTLA